MMTRTTINHAQLNGARALLDRYRQLYQQTDPHGRRGSAPHPGDVLYWLGCVGAISALLFVATR